MKFSFSWLVALLAGLAVLVGYFVPILGWLQELVVQVAVLLASFALLAGIFNLLGVHWNRVDTGKPGSGYSILLVFSFIIPLITAGLDFWFSGRPMGYWTLWAFRYIQVPVEASLFALLAVTLSYAAARMLSRRLDIPGLVFFVTIFLVLLLTSPYISVFLTQFGLGGVRNLFTQVLAAGGTRGLLLGVALGTIATGIRILMGVDRPYG